MRIFRDLIILVFFLYIASTYAADANKINKAFRSFWHPTFLGERLDYCTVDRKECGREVANRYCQMLGYEFSSQNIIAYNVGLTHFIASRAQCKGWQCNGFMAIDCAASLSHNPPQSYYYTEKKFVYPRFNNYRIDWCYNQHEGCGSRAAYSFCNRIGYMKAKYFLKEDRVSATRTLGSQELCFGNKCHGFKLIICTR